MFRLRYFPHLKRYIKDKIAKEKDFHAYKSIINDEVSQEQETMRQLWLVINPEQHICIEKATMFDFCLLLMFNVCHQTHRDLTVAFAEYLVDCYQETYGIDLGQKGVDETQREEGDGLSQMTKG